ncbi:hypothetical protein [Parendozoicomonas sp. Alg238-R29]|uniref:phage tail tube protein n=1 Tax=Parendozoicomonas sp. Alg238-R29 TaxID=2993446 RepID=UPI00248DC052|nr:hypothetical protein [Parendozoicomonas sp. Alg238-R29]
MSQVDRSFIGSGLISLQPYAGDAPLLPVGNVSEFTLSFEEETQTLPNSTGGGGNRNVLTRISGVTGSMNASDFNANNLAMALRAAVVSAATEVVTDEELKSFGVDGERIPFNQLPDLTQDVTVKKADDSALAEGIDYNLSKAGLVVIGDGKIDGDGIKVSYTPRKATLIKALVESGKEFKLMLEGLNEAQSGLPHTIRIHRIKFSPAQDLGFISDDFASLSMNFEILADPKITASDESQFFVIEMAD